MKHGKKYIDSAKAIEATKLYEVEEAIGLVLDTAKAKFDETVELHVRLGVDPKQADQQVRGVLVLPNGTGKEVKVLVLAKGEKADQAKEAAKAELDLMATVPVIYPNATSAKNEIDAVTPENNTLEAHNAAIETINTIVSNYRTSAYQALAGKMHHSGGD